MLQVEESGFGAGAERERVSATRNVEKRAGKL